MVSEWPDKRNPVDRQRSTQTTWTNGGVLLLDPKANKLRLPGCYALLRTCFPMPGVFYLLKDSCAVLDWI